MFLHIDKKELNNQELDFVLISCDAYVDHPTFGHAVISRIIYDKGFSIGIIPQPLCDQDYYALPVPKYAYLISSGVVDSMVNNYTVAKKKRTGDVYSPLSKQNKRPDRQVT
ncbi:MAG: YgiQ family radical SAM protein, partial [Clostridia bacterium]|nr:YgiQ family radical SAM protein [Clostridia bacterium]